VDGPCHLITAASKENCVDPLEVASHPFIVKIWLEETAEEAGAALWHGYITHVPSGKRRPLKDLDDIGTFVAPYLEEMGVRLDIRWRVRRWLKQRRQSIANGDGAPMGRLDHG
jgi:hypothetical protein